MSSHHKGKAVQTTSPRHAKPKAAGVTSPRPKAGPAWSVAQWLDALPDVLAALGLTLDAAQQQKLAAYMVMLAHWNTTFNLTALRDPRDMLTHHLADCLAVLPSLTRHLSHLTEKSPEPRLPAQGEGTAQECPVRLLDVGSGGGLPGVVLAITRPDVQVTCVDTVGKKAAFVRQVAAELLLPNLRAEHARVEQLKGQYEVITSRAFASVLDFVVLTRALLAPQGVWMAMKGKQPDEELAALPADVDVFHVEQLLVPGLDAQRCIVWMRQPEAAGKG